MESLDPFGTWGTSVHKIATAQWAQEMEYRDSAAAIVGQRDEDVDNGTKSPLPIVGDQSYHFNRNPKGQDSRLQHHDEHLKKAKECCMWKVGFWGWFSSYDNPKGAAKQLGLALHPLQDWVAHGDFGIKAKWGIYVWHNSQSPQASLGDSSARASAVDDPDLDSDGPDGRPAGTAMHYLPNGVDYALFHPGGQQRLTKTRELTEATLGSFLNHVRKEAKPCGECRAFFLKDSDPARWQ